MEPIKALDNIFGTHSIGCTFNPVWQNAKWDLAEGRVYAFWENSKTEIHLTVDKGKQECKKTFEWNAVQEILEFVNNPTGWQDKPIPPPIDPSNFGQIRAIEFDGTTIVRPLYPSFN